MSANLNILPKRIRWQILRLTTRFVTMCMPLFLLALLTGYTLQDNLYYTGSGHIKFTSDAPLEFIQAESNELAGILNIDDLSFSFTVPMVSFLGFNSALQRTHLMKTI